MYYFILVIIGLILLVLVYFAFCYISGYLSVDKEMKKEIEEESKKLFSSIYLAKKPISKNFMLRDDEIDFQKYTDLYISNNAVVVFNFNERISKRLFVTFGTKVYRGKIRTDYDNVKIFWLGDEKHQRTKNELIEHFGYSFVLENYFSETTLLFNSDNGWLSEGHFKRDFIKIMASREAVREFERIDQMWSS